MVSVFRQERVRLCSVLTRECVHCVQVGEMAVCLFVQLTHFKRDDKMCRLTQTGESEMNNYFDLNPYLDRILDVLLKYGGDRKVIFSTFHADTCIL